jgi:tetratricopeptide (TPR) repeat protein
MSKKKVISIIVGVVVVLGGVWFLMEKRGVTSNLVEENQIQPEVQIPLDESKVVEDESEKAPVVDVEKKFNELMVKARTAFGASNYAATIQYYNEALTYKKDDTAYVGLYTVYLTQKNWTKALESINKAIAVSALYGDYWKWKLLVMAEGMNASFAELEKVYTEGLPKVKSQEKINLVTYFADLSAKKGEKSYAVNLWQKAIEMNPESKDVYQKEIDNLENI